MKRPYKSIVLVIGLGQVGSALFELVKESRTFKVYGVDVDKKKMQEFNQNQLPKTVDVMHVCIRCLEQDSFVATTVRYMKQFNPKLTIINSTVPPRTTEKIGKQSEGYLAHSPIRGMHKNAETMKQYLIRLTKYIGGVDSESAELAQKHFEELGLKTKTLSSSMATELAKLFETTYRAWMISCFQEMHRISRHFGADFDEVVDFLEDTHLVRFDRPIMFPDVIGGHCLIPNTELLLKSYESQFLKLILESNDKRKKEIKNKDVMAEVGKVKQRAKILEEKLCSAENRI